MSDRRASQIPTTEVDEDGGGVLPPPNPAVRGKVVLCSGCLMGVPDTDERRVQIKVDRGNGRVHRLVLHNECASGLRQILDDLVAPKPPARKKAPRKEEKA